MEGRVVHDWPVGGTNWRGSRQILQKGGEGWWGGGEEYWVPQAVQMGRGEVVDMVDGLLGGEGGYFLSHNVYDTTNVPFRIISLKWTVFHAEQYCVWPSSEMSMALMTASNLPY